MPSAIGSEKPFTPNRGRFCVENSLRYLDSCYVDPPTTKNKDLPSIKETLGNCFLKIWHFLGTGYFAAVGTIYKWLLNPTIDYTMRLHNLVCTILMQFDPTLAFSAHCTIWQFDDRSTRAWSVTDVTDTWGRWSVFPVLKITLSGLHYTHWTSQ